MEDKYKGMRAFFHDACEWPKECKQMEIAVQYCVDRIGLAITKSSIETCASEFKTHEDEHKNALMKGGLKLIEARQVMGAVIKAAQGATAAAPTPISAKGGSSKGGSSKEEGGRGSSKEEGGRGGSSKGKGGRVGSQGKTRGWPPVELHGMGRGTVPQIINHQCKIVVDAGLEWAQRDGVEGLVNPVGSEWTATGEKHMKEVVRKLVTASEWEDLQQSHYNLQGLSAQMLEDPKKWPHAARIQLEAWFVKQIRETRRRMKQAEAFSEAAVKEEPGAASTGKGKEASSSAKKEAAKRKAAGAASSCKGEEATPSAEKKAAGTHKGEEIASSVEKKVAGAASKGRGEVAVSSTGEGAVEQATEFATTGTSDGMDGKNIPECQSGPSTKVAEAVATAPLTKEAATADKKRKADEWDGVDARFRRKKPAVGDSGNTVVENQ